jgi:hypothetical protein
LGDLVLVGTGTLGLARLLGAGALFGLGLDGLHCLTHLREARLASGELGRYLVAPPVLAEGLVLFPVDRLGLSENLAHLGIELFDLLVHVVIAHGLVPARRGPQLGAVEGDPSEL